MPFGPIKLWEFGALICIRTAQSGTQGGDFWSYQPGSTPSLSTENWRLRLPGWAEIPKMFHQSTADQCGAKQPCLEQSGVDHRQAEQSCLAGEEPGPRAASQLCYILITQWNFLLHSTPNWGFQLMLIWHQWPSVDNIKEVIQEMGKEVADLSPIEWTKLVLIGRNIAPWMKGVLGKWITYPLWLLILSELNL